MNTFNRGVLVLLCVGLVAAAAAIIVLTWTIPNRSVNWLADAVEWIDSNDGDVERALLTTFGAFIGTTALIVLLIELIPRSGPDVPVSDLTSGDATLSADALGQRIEEAVRQVPNVSEVRANVRARKEGVLVGLDLHVEPEANLASVSDQACDAAQQVLNDRVHVTLLRPPSVKLHYRELRLRRRGAARREAARRAAAPVSPPAEAVSEAPTASPSDQAAASESPQNEALSIDAAANQPEAGEAPNHEAESTEKPSAPDAPEPAPAASPSSVAVDEAPSLPTPPPPPELPPSLKRRQEEIAAVETQASQTDGQPRSEQPDSPTSRGQEEQKPAEHA